MIGFVNLASDNIIKLSPHNQRTDVFDKYSGSGQIPRVGAGQPNLDTRWLNSLNTQLVIPDRSVMSSNEATESIFD